MPITVGALDLLTAAAALADGTRQITLDLDTGVPGLVDLEARLAVGEPPQAAWFAVGSRGAIARTAQVRLALVATVLGNSVTGGSLVRLPVYIEIAPAEARVANATCPSGSGEQGSATIEAMPGIAKLAIGEVGASGLTAFGAPPNVSAATLIDLPLLEVTGRAAMVAGAVEPEPLRFSATDIEAGRVRTAATRTALRSAVTSVIDNLELEVETFGLGLGAGLIEDAVRGLLVPVAPALDIVLVTVLDALGVSLGEADVRVHGVTCSRPVLVG